MAASLGEFLKSLEAESELLRVKSPVNPKLEIAEICDRVVKPPAAHGHQDPDRSPAAALGGKALLFESVQGSDIPVATNTFGSYHRVNKALGSANLADLAARIEQLVKPEVPPTLLE